MLHVVLLDFSFIVIIDCDFFTFEKLQKGSEVNLWSPYVIGQTIYIFMLFLLSFFISSPNLSRRRLDVCHTSTHGVALVRI